MPRYYKYGFQGPQYAGQWSHQVPALQTQAPGLRYGLGADTKLLESIESPLPNVAPDVSKLSDKELNILIVFTEEAMASSAASKDPVRLALGKAMLAGFKDEKARRTRNKILLIGAAGVGIYYFTRRK
jgi:hypothetical protein